MSQEQYAGFLESDIDWIETGFEIIEAEQRGLPTWLRGLPLNSPPLDLYYEMIDQQVELEATDLPPEVFDFEYQQLSRRIILLVDMHIRHRQLMLAETYVHGPKAALVNSRAEVERMLMQHEGVYESWEPAEHLPFLKVVIDAYLSFYYPGGRRPS